MSNANVGAVYEHIIDEVINTVRVDFEEGGVGEDILEELKKCWQHKLSQLNVAQFPWDPKPEPPPPAPAPAPAPVAAPVHLPPTTQQQAAAASYTQATLTPQATPHSALAAQHANGNGNGMPIKTDNESHIKQEPTMTGMSAPAMTYNNAGVARGGMAAQRAAQALENRYGPRAAASIDAIQSGQAQAQAQAQAQQQGQRPGQPQQPQQMQQMQQMQMNHQQMQQLNQQQQQQLNQQQMNQQQMNQQQMSQQQMMNQQQAAQHQLNQQQQQYRQGLAASMQQRMPQQPPSNLPKAQHDGAADGFEGVLLQHGPDGRPVEMGRVEIDKIMHAQMAARAKEMEGGGLMVPLKAVKRQAGTASRKATSGGPSQVDGPDDEDTKVELDEDAINSDLDDPDEPRDEDEDDDDSMGHMMLCMYDKVQRVKNKWKCTLKDGVLTVNGREYVFHKATGEYEW